ncbi:MAG: adenylosuccinate lyase [Proteobacteria bacterium]|nr:adenylosuccinate lyase [Pseudomonadota bacterium]MBU1386375.1 adenylosuccinate lyase [Pseudomonadota bacterium]MBU1544486.1 adenylosuccinate lyase [Pseudomonadota bacterium]MBU2430265.1 adenylosuccinate lyase [Pseudomonadota bacterium]MBU2480335.1 adenylosuccinate lyase [Pseudomonadota bacterium]
MITALTALDGRYAKLTGQMAHIFSEYGLIRHRVFVEIEWLKFILSDLKLAHYDTAHTQHIDAIAKNFDVKDAQAVKDIEKKTNHDVKAVEYFIKDRLDGLGLSDIKEWVHFACTSDDINNTAYALMLDEGRKIVKNLLDQMISAIEQKALEYKSVPMMGRTHGQPATPTTVGKEFVNFAWRISQEACIIEQATVQAKLNGATGNFNAHHFVYPEIDWIKASKRFISKHLGLEPILFTTQVNPNHSIAFILHAMIRTAAITIDFDRDMWGYISLGYFKQRIKKGETGSSTMPHKVNPIDFENSEGNMGIAISMMEHLSVKLQKSRFQRDLSDSTVLRSLGAVFGYFVIGVENALKGLSKLDLNSRIIQKDLDENQELLAEPFQTAMRVFGEDNPYERLKDLTRGQKITKSDLENFVDKLEKVPENFKSRMKNLTPQAYIGLAIDLVDTYFKEK